MSVTNPRTSRRAILRGLGATGGAFAVAGCAGLAANAPRFDASEFSGRPTLLVATTRRPVNGARANPWYGAERASGVTVARVRLHPPDDGRFSLASIGMEDWRIESVEPVSDTTDVLRQATSGRNVLLFVHGYNQTFEAAVLNAARLSDGIKFSGETMAFSWPSRGKLLDYVYDRDSAMWSRDALQQIVEGLMSSETIGRINIVAHSVGTMLTLEALRQLYAKRGAAAADRIGAIVFASPDIDMDVFTGSVPRIGPLAAKITVITATDDRALAVSGWLSGGTTRVGAAEKAQLEKIGLHVLDASQRGWGIINHDRFLSNAGIRQAIREAVGGPSRGGAPGGVELGGNLGPVDGAEPQMGAGTN